MLTSALTHDDYIADPAMSKSKLDMIERDIHSLEWAENAPTARKSEALIFGTAMHAKLLEPMLFDAEYVIAPEFNRRTKQGKADEEQWLSENKGKTVITHDDAKKIDLMFESVMAHPLARKLIESEGPVENSVFWSDPHTGIECKARPDKILENNLLDVKTTPELSKFKYSVEDYRYHVQEAFYLDGVKNIGINAERMLFLVIGKTLELGRYPVLVTKLPLEMVDYGILCYQKNLDDYKRWLDSGKKLMIKELELHPGFLARMEQMYADGVY